jgi:6-phosphogluconolactonase (cycloisomerase 2 family)
VHLKGPDTGLILSKYDAATIDFRTIYRLGCERSGLGIMKKTARFPFFSLLMVVVTAVALSSCGTFVCNPIGGSGTGTGAALVRNPTPRVGDGNKSTHSHPLLNPAASQASCSSGGGGNNGACSSTDTPTQVMYSVDGTGAIVAYGIDASGTLTLICPTAKAAVGELVVSNNKFLYVLDESTVPASIHGFIIGHANTGTVVSNGQTFTFAPAPELLDSATHIEADPTGHLLFVTDYDGGVGGTGLIHVFLINQGAGTLTEATGSPVSVVTNPDFLAVSSDGKFAYVPDDVVAQIHVFALDANTGAMTETASSPFNDDGGSAEPGRFIAIHPNGKFLYTTNTSQMSAYGVDSTTGNLSAVPGSPFDMPATMIPEIFAIDNTGGFLYVTDFNDPGIGIAGFPIDSTGTGALQGQVPNSPFALFIANTIVANPLGPEVYVLGGNTEGDLINIFGVAAGTGSLTGSTATLKAQSNLVISNVQ